MKQQKNMDLIWQHNIKGKENDHVFHNACQAYVIKYCNKIRIDGGLPPIF